MCHCWRHHIWQDTLSAARSTAYGPIAVAQRGPFFAQEKTWQFQLSSEKSFVVNGFDTCILQDEVMIFTKISWGKGPIWQVLDGEIALCIIFLGSVEATRFVELFEYKRIIWIFRKKSFNFDYNWSRLNEIHIRFMYIYIRIFNGITLELLGVGLQPRVPARYYPCQESTQERAAKHRKRCRGRKRWAWDGNDMRGRVNPFSIQTCLNT